MQVDLAKLEIPAPIYQECVKRYRRELRAANRARHRQRLEAAGVTLRGPGRPRVSHIVDTAELVLSGVA